MHWENSILPKIPLRSRRDWLIHKDNSRSSGGDQVTATLTPQCPASSRVTCYYRVQRPLHSTQLFPIVSLLTFLFIFNCLYLLCLRRNPRTSISSSSPFLSYPPLHLPLLLRAHDLQMLPSQGTTESDKGTSIETNHLARLRSDTNNEKVDMRKKVGKKQRNYFKIRFRKNRFYPINRLLVIDHMTLLLIWIWQILHHLC